MVAEGMGNDDKRQGSRGCYVYIILRKKTLATLKDHEWLRTVAVGVEGNSGNAVVRGRGLGVARKMRL
ncbi:hypothetical protein B296_00041849 [Ensete ventricosum]|uniref:Uncharacterized protein n=1 Tax=Ensete ventricosum TaxID=4639 RepID=A0A426ZC68_ENSVE|nr:hypothetical protein B296_00041849 [Ensete ventricosum]